MTQLSETRAPRPPVPVQGGGVEITGCGRTTAAGVVAFTVRWAGDLPPSGTVTWAARVTAPDGREAVLLGYQLALQSRGPDARQYVEDLSSGRVQELAADAEVDAEEVTVRFPASAVGVAVEWPTWQAVIAVDGAEVATQTITT
jgi:hypothetical protein